MVDDTSGASSESYDIWHNSKDHGDQAAIKFSISVNDAGKFFYNVFIPKPPDATILDQALGKSAHDAVVAAYEERLTRHLGFPPATRDSMENGIKLTFNLPENKMYLDKESFIVAWSAASEA